MIKLLDILKEIQSKDLYYISDRIVKVRTAVQKFFQKNKEQLSKFAETDNWDAYYKLGFAALPEFRQEEVAQALDNEAMAAGWYTENIIPLANAKSDNKKASTQIDQLSDVNEINAVVSDWVRKNKAKLIKLADDNNYKEFYQLVKDKFPLAPEDKLVQAMNAAAIEHDIHYELITEV